MIIHLRKTWNEQTRYVSLCGLTNLTIREIFPSIEHYKKYKIRYPEFSKDFLLCKKCCSIAQEKENTSND